MPGSPSSALTITTRGPGSRRTASHFCQVGKPAPPIPVSPEASSRSSTSSWVELRWLPDVVGLEQEAVRRVGDAAAHVVAVQHDGRKVAVAEARHLDRAVREERARAGAVADRSRADADGVGRDLQEGVERDDLVHLAPSDRHVIGERVRELRPDRPDLAAQPAEVVEQARPLRRQLAQQLVSRSTSTSPYDRARAARRRSLLFEIHMAGQLVNELVGREFERPRLKLGRRCC